MRTHYARVRGYKRYPGRPVYQVVMSKEEVRERRALYVVISGLVLLIGAVVMAGVMLA